jgi:hypothetical protein
VVVSTTTVMNDDRRFTLDELATLAEPRRGTVREYS